MENSTGNSSTSFECPHSAPDSALILGVKTTAYVMIMVTSLCGNVLTICVICRSPRMRNPVNYLIINLAAADLLVTSFNMTARLVDMVTRSSQWSVRGVPGLILCKALYFMFGFSISCSILSLTVLAVERFVAIRFPLKRFLDNGKLKYVNALIWLASFASVSPLLYAVKLIEVDGSLYCGEDWGPVLDPVRSPQIYTIVYFVLMYALPLSAITVLYGLVVHTVWFRRIPGNALKRDEARRTRTRKKVLRMLVTIVAVFALCWLPLHINMFLMYLVEKFAACNVPSGLSFFAMFLGHSNSAINPCLYVIFNKDFRRGFKDILCLCVPDKRLLTLGVPTIYGASSYNLQQAPSRTTLEDGTAVQLKNFQLDDA